MKKIIIMCIALIILTACSNDLNKKVNLAEWKSVITNLKSTNKDYSEADYNTAGDELFKMASNGESLDITYKELLDTAKQKNVEYQKEIAKYQASIQKLDDVLKIEIIGGEYRYLDEEPYPNIYVYEMSAQNNGKKTIVAIKGSIKFFNTNDKLLFTTYFDKAANLTPGTNVNHDDYGVIDEDDELIELKSLPFSAIKWKWLPESILFEDGSRLDALPEVF